MSKIVDVVVDKAGDAVNKVFDALVDFVKSQRGQDMLKGAAGASLLLTETGRAMLMQAAKTIVSGAGQVAKIGATKAAKATAKALSTKLGGAVGEAAAAAVAGYMLGAEIGYLITDKKSQQPFLRDLAINVATGNPWGAGVVAAARKGIQTAKDRKATAQAIEPSVKEAIKQVAFTQTGGIVTPQQSGKQVVEYERSKANKRPAIKTTSDKFAEYMKKNSKMSNHPEWYTRFPEFVTTNLNFGIRKEAQYYPVAIGALIKVAQMIPQRDKKVSQSYVDQMQVLFAKLRGSNSGAFNYTTSDVMNYIECVRSIRIIMYTLSKLIKSVNNVDLYVCKTPDAFMSVLGMSATDIADLKENRALYVARFNQYAEMINANFPTPPNMSVFDRDKYIASIVLEEGKGPKSSIFNYKFTQLIVANTGTGNEGKIAYDGLNSTTGVSALFTKLDSYINAAHAYVSATYTNYDTFAKIAGDIFKAYGSAGLNFKVEPLNLNDKVAVLYDEYLLHQLQNAQVVTIVNNQYLTVSGDTPTTITYSAKIAVDGANTSNTIPADKLIANTLASSLPLTINTNKKEVTGAEAISLTRGNWYYERSTAINYGTSSTTVEVDTCDTILMMQLFAYYYDVNNNISSINMRSTALNKLTMTQISMWSQLDYAPAFYIYDDSGNTGSPHLVEDIDTFAYMTVAQYKAFTDTAVISLYKTVDISDQVNFRTVKSSPRQR